MAVDVCAGYVLYWGVGGLAYQYHLSLCGVLGSLPGQEAESVLPKTAAATQLRK